jgi:hypothetical protein
MKPKNLLILFILVYLGAFGYLLSRTLDLRFNGELIALLPEDNPHIASFKKLNQLNSSEGGFTLILHSKNGNNVIGEAKRITAELLELRDDSVKVFRGAELENDLYDIRNSALFLMTREELNQLHQEVSNYIDDQKRAANPLYVDLGEEESTEGIDIGSNTSVLLEEMARSKRYDINEDSTVISVLFLPDFPKSDYTRVESSYLLLLDKKVEIEAQNPDIEMYWGGSYVNHYDKINDVQYSVSKALVIGIMSLLIFLVGYMLYVNRGRGYRMSFVVIDLLLVFFILFSGFAISLGISTFLFHELNVFTSIIFSILFGINLDYILHLYSVNKQRQLDTSSFFGVIRSYLSTTKPILLSCLTTGLAIMSLIFADFDGFVQFGIIFFINILVNLFSTYLFLLLSPSMAKEKSVSKNTDEEVLSYFSSIARSPRLIWIPSLILIIAAGSFFGARSLSFNFSFSDLEPETKPTPYRELSGEIGSGSSYHDPAYFIADDINESKELFSFLRDEIGNTYPDIERVESFSARYPINEQEFSWKAVKVDSLQDLISRNDEFLKKADEEAQEFIEIARNTVAPTISTLPKYIRNRFFYKDGSLAPLVIIYPAMSLSNGATSIAFRKSSGIIEMENGKEFYAASTFIIASSILELLIQESTFLFLVPLLTIMVLLLIYYRSFVKAFLAVLPLLFTFGALLSIRAIFPFDINLYNVIVFPIVIGVGADNGIHLVDALISKRDHFLEYFVTSKFPVLAACSFTTVLGFIGLLFIDHPGMESIGILAVIGISVTLAATYFTSLVVQTFVLKK